MLCPNMTIIPDPRYGDRRKYAEFRDKQLAVPCKKCTACKINHTSEWTMRMMMELQSWDSARFITLTYKPGTTPENKSLVAEDLSDFWKALRQNLDGRPIKYYACGEYGEQREMPGSIPGSSDWEKGKRPHYHAIVYGLTGSKEDRIAVFDAWKKAEEFQWFGKNWQKCCGSVTPDSCSYVAGYCQKKLFGDMAQDEYFSQGKIPPFQTQSKGIGEKYFLEHIEQYKKDGFILFRGARHPIPDTWKRKFELDFTRQKDEFYEKEREDFLIQHPSIDSEYYDWFYFHYGYTMSREDVDELKQNIAIDEIIKAKNNLTRRKIL